MVDQSPILRSCLIGVAVLTIQWSVVPRAGYQNVIIRSEERVWTIQLPLSDPRLAELQAWSGKIAKLAPPRAWQRETVATRWQAEIAQLYADREKEGQQRRRADDLKSGKEGVARMPAGLSGMHLAGHRAATAPGIPSGWSSYWAQQASQLQETAVERNTAWLQWKERQQRRFELGQRDSGPISNRQFAWMLGVAVLTAILTWTWIVSFPRRAVHPIVLKDSGGTALELAGSRDFVTIRQPWSVWLRSSLGWALTGVAAMSFAWHPWIGL
ncbi:MAG: hypothetical protein AAGD07_23385 [Planctomycetota bacterium]